MIRRLILALFLVSFLALASAEYYWADDYYRSGDYYRNSRDTYHENTYYRGSDYDNYERYYDDFLQRRYPWRYSDSDRYDSDSRRDSSPTYTSNYDSYYRNGPRVSNEPSVVYIRDTDYYLYHSKTFDRDYVMPCTANPEKGSFFYIKC